MRRAKSAANGVTVTVNTRRNLRAISADGVAFSLMVGLGETYVPAFALAIGMSEVAAGWIVSMPLLAGAMLQLSSMWAIRKLGSHRRWVVSCAVVQALIFAGYVAVAIAGDAPAWVLFAIATIYWGSGLATGPAWNTWVSTLIPRRIRAMYFARRTRFAQGAVLLGLVAGGLALEWGRDQGVLLETFAILFLAAGLARGVSAWVLSRQSEPQPLPAGHRVVSLRGWFARLVHEPKSRLLLYMLAVQIAVQISGPFFTPYMLNQIEFSYAEYLTLISTSFVAKTLVLPTVGVLVRRFGAQRMLYAGAAGIIPLAALWTVSDSFTYLLCVQIVSGSIWAIQELCTFLLLFEHIDERERTSVLTIFNVANAVAMVAGSLIGGLLLHALGQDADAYHVLFAISSVLRIGTLFLLLRLHEVTFRPVPLAVRTLAVRPNTGSLDAPVVTSLEAQRPDHGNILTGDETRATGGAARS